MSQTHFIRRNRFNGSLVAASFVLMMGATCSAILWAGAGADPVLTVVFVGAIAVAVLTVLYLLSAVPAGGSSLYQWVKSRYARPEHVDYQPRIRREPSCSRFGTNAPPTIEEIRELRDGGNTWVPSGDRARLKRR